MPLHKVKTEILTLLAGQRNPESDMAGQACSTSMAHGFPLISNFFTTRKKGLPRRLRWIPTCWLKTGFASNGSGGNQVFMPRLCSGVGKVPTALEEADGFVRTMPAGKEGRLFLKEGIPVQPEPDNLASYEEHAGRRRGVSYGRFAPRPAHGTVWPGARLAAGPGGTDRGG